MSRTADGYAKGRAKRAEIVEQASALFAEVGFRAASMLELAHRCGLTRPGLLHHFPTKEAVLEAVLARRDDLEHETFRASGAGAPDGLGVLRGMVALATTNTGQPGIIEAFGILAAEAAEPGHPAHDYFVRRYARIVAGTERALVRAQRAGLLRADVDAGEAAVALTALMDGLQVQWLLAPERVDMAGVLRHRIQELLTVDLGA